MTTKGPSEFFTNDHRLCDREWAELESAAEAGKLDEAAKCWARVDASMRRHYAMEEEVLFPAVESATGMFGGGPTAVMRSEHEQMRGLLDQMGQAAAQADFETLLDQGDTLLMLIQQHNVKEEGILYPLADQALGAQWSEMESKLAEFS